MRNESVPGERGASAPRFFRPVKNRGADAPRSPKVALAVLLALAATLPAADGDPVPTRVERDVTYASVNGEELKFDLAAPRQGDGPFPAVVCFHGGAWQFGSRRQLSTRSPLFNGRAMIDVLAERGYVAVSVGYRLAPRWKFPAQIQDCKAAVRYLREHARELRIDPDRVGAVGFSAGAHLACLLGTTDRKDGFDAEGGPTTRVQAVCSFFGPTDFTPVERTPETQQLEDALIKPWLGASSKENPAVYAKASPVCYVTPDDPPFLFIHGTRDPLVALDHSRGMAKRLQAAKVPARVVEVDGAGHGWVGTRADLTTAQMLDFFDGVLKK